MLEQLQGVKIPSCKFIQLRFRYRVDNSNIKILSLVLSSDRKGIRPLSVFDLLMSVKNEIIQRILVIQHESVNWETVSITYPNSRFGAREDILKLPLQGFNGFCQDPGIDPYQLFLLNVSLRFPGRPMPKQVKIHGVYREKTEAFGYAAEQCAKAFVERFTIPEIGVSYKVCFSVQNRQKPDKSVKGKKKEQQKKDEYIEPVMCFWKTE